jgi:hypothetical protein
MKYMKSVFKIIFLALDYLALEAYVSRVRGPHTHKEKQKKRDGRSEVNRRLEYYYFAQCRDKDYVVVNL